MRHFLFEEKEYHYRPVFKRRRKTRDSAAELARLLRTAAKGSVPRAGKHAPDLRQKCIAKMNYSSSIEAHKYQLDKYLVQEGKGLDGSIPELFGTDTEEYRNNIAGRNFRIFLSPESSGVDVKALAGKFMEKLEKQTGYRLYWQGACHYNTAHAHAHLLINGIDKDGREVNIPRDIVKTFMRETSRDLCTAQAGWRTQADLDRERERELSASRYTRIDSRIAEMNVNLRVRVGRQVKDKERILARLECLRKLKLCSYENGGYVLKKDWQEDLKNNAKYNVFLKARGELHYTDPSLMTVYSGAQGLIAGKVTKIYRTDDDASDNHAVVIEGFDGKAYFVPLFKKPEMYDGKNKTNLKEGELVTLKTYENQRGRLTPLIFRLSLPQAKGEIRKNGLNGGLASELADGSYRRNG